MLFNAQAEKLFGYTRDEMMGKKVEMLVPMAVRAGHPAPRDGSCAAPRSRAMGSGRDLFGVRKNGSEVSIEICLNPIETAEARFALTATADLTERLERERLLQKQRDEILELSRPILQVWEKVLADHRCVEFTARRALDREPVTEDRHGWGGIRHSGYQWRSHHRFAGGEKSAQDHARSCSLKVVATDCGRFLEIAALESRISIRPCKTATAQAGAWDWGCRAPSDWSMNSISIRSLVREPPP